MATQIQLRRGTAAQWSLANPILAQGEMGVETDTNQFKLGDGVQTWSALSYGGIAGPAQTLIMADYGSGEDGNVTLSAGVTTLTNDVYYNNLTLTGSAELRANGYRIFVKNNLDLTAAGVNAINNSGLPGSNSATQAGAAGGGAYAVGTLGINTAGGGGGTGVVGVGVQAVATVGTSPSNGSASGAGGAGGAGGSGAGGALRAAATTALQLDFGRFTYDVIRGISLIQGGAGGPGGSSGAGDGVNLGRGGGGGGAGGGVLYIAAKNVLKSVSTPASVIAAKGGAAGNGASGAAGNIGGGGGGAGGGGGYILFYYETKSGPSVSNMFSASGGDGGNGGNGFGTGIGGAGGGGGTGGRIRTHETKTGTSVVTVGSAGVSGTISVTITGGAAGAGGASVQTF